MQMTMDSTRRQAHLSRRERQRLARARAFSRRTAATPPVSAAVALAPSEVALIEQLVRHDRTAVSTALLVVAGIGAGELRRRAVLARVGEIADKARADGAISGERGAQIVRHVGRALEERDEPIGA
jgi:hypothetical protein